jgi:hypothetical protein
MSNLPVVPDYLKAFMAPGQTQSSDTESMASASISIPRVSLRAKKFRWIEQGEELFAEPESHVVILAAEPGSGRFVKTYYDGPYNPGDSSPPTCSSSDGVTPDSWVTTPQNGVCATCKWNQFGSATSRTGKKSKACRDAKRLWLVRADDISGTVFGMNVPVTSLKSLSELGHQIKSINAPLSAAVVKLTMDEDESYPIISFTLEGWLNDKWGPVAMKRNEGKDWPGALKDGPAGPALSAPARQPQLPVNEAEQVKEPSTQAKVAQTPQTIEGQSTPAKGNSADDALSTWG